MLWCAARLGDAKNMPSISTSSTLSHCPLRFFHGIQAAFRSCCTYRLAYRLKLNRWTHTFCRGVQLSYVLSNRRAPLQCNRNHYVPHSKKQHLKMVLCKLCVSGFEHCGPDYTHTVSAGHLSAHTTIHPMVHNSLINDSCWDKGTNLAAAAAWYLWHIMTEVTAMQPV